ncbi:hypothetical protein F5X68DRAFT_237231 [Plectosphaerella plurivora]|uniref:Zn(2)-C6 fungal-type domain-containing protein n=1 Tax=Plectosphaerella plurivora TaxID=936078 RepID=A0A9P8V1V3_9PEZI|nr:hypothetical protein F5X68DRAFT_237231 [Plectosphaerella plurivora]
MHELVCDEEKPQCRNCLRLSIDCPGYAPALQFINSSSASVPISRRSRRKVAEARQEHEQPRSSPEAEITAQLEDDNDGHYPIATPEAFEHDPDVDNIWVSDQFPPQLPSVFRSLWESIGFGNDVVKYAVLAHASAHPADTAMGFYSRALRAFSVSAQGPASWLLPDSDLHGVVISLAVLALLQLYEMKHGTFLGGFTHCRQADQIVVTHLDRLDLRHPLDAIDTPFGLLHLLFHCIVLRGASVEILEWLMDLAPRLEAAGSYVLGLVPMWIFKKMTMLVLQERRAGRILLAVFSDFKATDEIVDTRSPTAARFLVLGVEAATQDTFQSIVEIAPS